MLLLRMTAIGIPGLIGGAVIIAQEDLLIANHLARFQTPEIAIQVILLSVVAMASTLIAWLQVSPANGLQGKGSSGIRGSIGLRLCMYLAIGIVGAILVAPSRGSPIWEAPYASEEIEIFGELNILGAVTLFSLIAAFAYSYFTQLNSVQLALLRIAIIGLVCYTFVIRGTRNEFVMLVLGTTLIWLEYHGKKVNILMVAGLAGVALLVSQFWALYRTVAATDIPPGDVITHILYSVFTLQTYQEVSGRVVLDVANALPSQYIYHLFGVIGLIEEGSLTYYYADSYAKYIPMTPPSSIYPDRPKDLAWLFDSFGETSGGAFPELAEAFLNFGMPGCIIVPWLISLLYFRAYRWLLETRSPRAFMWNGILAGLCVRVTWYGTFSLYKGLLAWLLVESILGVIVMAGQRRGYRTPPMAMRKSVRIASSGGAQSSEQ